MLRNCFPSCIILKHGRAKKPICQGPSKHGFTGHREQESGGNRPRNSWPTRYPNSNDCEDNEQESKPNVELTFGRAAGDTISLDDGIQ